MYSEREWIIFLKQFVLEYDDYEVLSTCFDMPIRQAAKLFDVSLSFFKKRCRKCGIKRWPARQINCLLNLKKSNIDINESEIDECINNLFWDTEYKVPDHIQKLKQQSYKEISIKNKKILKKRNKRY